MLGESGQPSSMHDTSTATDPSTDINYYFAVSRARHNYPPSIE